MNKNRRQDGSILIIILIVVVVGLIGFIIWQNFFNKSDTQNTTQSTPIQQANQNDNKQAATKTLKIAEWGVALNKPANDDTYRYTVQDDYAVWISNDTLDKFLNNGTDCEVRGVQLSKIPTSSVVDEGQVNGRAYSSDVNGYKYGVVKGLPSFGACSDNKDLIAAFESARDALIAELGSIN